MDKICSLRVKMALLFLSVLQASFASQAQEAGQCCPEQLSKPVLSVPEEVNLDSKLTVRNWYVAIGFSNYYPGLRESEAKINKQLNAPLGIIPGWEKPTTFADWRDRSLLWDATIGAGRDLSPKLTLMFWTGGAAGTIKSKARYGFLSTDIRFTRISTFLTPELFWYPHGKIDYDALDNLKGGQRIRTALASIKPFLSFASGYTFVRAKADARLQLPLVGTFFRRKESEDHHMYMVSPRLGLEMPLGKRTSLTMSGIYYFFGPNHSREYNGPCFSFSIRRQF